MPPRTRSRLLKQLQAIRSFPSEHSDSYEQDAIGRRVEICVRSGWAIHYWIDFADRQVKVLALNPADR